MCMKLNQFKDRDILFKQIKNLRKNDSRNCLKTSQNPIHLIQLNQEHTIIIMNSKDPVLDKLNQGPFIERRQDNPSHRSLYSDHEPQFSPGIIRKSVNHESHTHAINPQPVIQYSIRSPRHNISQQAQQNRRYQSSEQQDQLQPSHLQQPVPQSKQFMRSLKQVTLQNPSEFRHEYKNYKNKYQSHNDMNDIEANPTYDPKQSPKNLLKFHQHIKPKAKYLTDEFSKDSYNGTMTNFNQFNSLDFTKVNHQDIKNRSLRSSQGGRWLRSQSLMQQNQRKNSFQQSLIKNYHKHESKYFTLLQNYLKAFMQFEEKLARNNLGISLMNSLQDIKVKMQLYMEKLVKLENLPIDKPTFQWTQGQLTKFFSNYEPIFLPAQSIDSLTQTLTLKKYKNCVYFGHMANGKKQGEGVIYYFGGKIFEGRFVGDQKAYGFEMEEDGEEVYVGQFEKGLRHGVGVVKNGKELQWGEFREGEFRSDSRKDSTIAAKMNELNPTKFTTTNTTFTSNNRVKLVQDQAPHAANKQGIILNFNHLFIFTQSLTILKPPSNDLYIGEYNPSTHQKHGLGLQIFTNGDLYIGQYQSNTPQKYGEYYWSSGAYYRGEFMSGMRHGKGKWHMLHGDCYEGEYMNDKKNGKGVYHWKNGAKYEGRFENDYRHGYGEMLWGDGRVYKGEWINGIEKNVQIKLDKGFDNNAVKNPGTTIRNHHNTTLSSTNSQKKKVSDARKSFLPGVTKRTLRSSSNPNTKNSFHTLDPSQSINKKIAIENIKALYNPSNI